MINNHILGISAETKESPRENQFLFEFKSSITEVYEGDKFVGHNVDCIFNLTNTISTVTHFNYSYLENINRKYNCYTNNLVSLLKITNNQGFFYKKGEGDTKKDAENYKDLYLKNIVDFLCEIFKKTNNNAKNFYTIFNTKVNEKTKLDITKNFSLYGSLYKSPYLAKLFELDNSLYDILNNYKTHIIDKEIKHKSLKFDIHFSNSSIESKLDNTDNYFNQFYKESNFLKLPLALRLDKTDKYKQYLINKGIYFTDKLSNLEKYTKSIKLEQFIKINNTLDEYSTIYKPLEDNIKTIIHNEPKPCKKFIKQLNTLNSLPLINQEQEKPKCFQVFKAILENITRDSNGDLCPLYYNFVIAHLSHFINNPTQPLKQNERGYILFEGIQKSGKSTFLKMLQLLFDENVVFTNNNDVMLLNDPKSMNVEPEPYKKARFIVMEETIDFSLKNKEKLKDLIFLNQLKFARKYKTSQTIDVNYTFFLAYNKNDNQVRGDIFLENDKTNRRFVFCNSTLTLAEYFADIGLELKDIDEVMANKDNILTILQHLKAENSEYNYEVLDENDTDKQEKVKRAIHTTEGLLLEKLIQMNNGIMEFLTSYNIPQRTVDINKLYPNNKEIKIPLNVFNSFCWQSKTPTLRRRKAKETLDRLIEENKNLLSNIEILNNHNVIYFKITNKNTTNNDVNI